MDHPTVLVRITTPVGEIGLIGEARIEQRTVYIDQAHVGGLAANALGRRGLNAIGRKLLEVAQGDPAKFNTPQRCGIYGRDTANSPNESRRTQGARR